VAAWWRGRSRSDASLAPESAVRRALLAVLDGDLERAESLLTGLVQHDSTDLEAYLALARLFRQRGEFGRAIHVHQNLLLRRDTDPEARFQALVGLADDFRGGGFLRRAIAAYEEVLADRPDHAGALRALVTLLVAAREPRRAIPLARRLARAERHEPGAAEAVLWAELAEIERTQGDGESARKALRRALRRDAQCVRAWIALGEVESELGRPRKAVAAWRRAVALDRRTVPRVVPRLAAAAAALDRSSDHERWLRAGLDEQPDDVELRLALARALSARGAVEEAEAELRASLERDPESLAAHAALGRLLLAEGRAEAAAKAHEELLGVLERRADALAAGPLDAEPFP
jgi:lipopolysaccharide biosynthesis regulator YciM